MLHHVVASPSVLFHPPHFPQQRRFLSLAAAASRAYSTSIHASSSSSPIAAVHSLTRRRRPVLPTDPSGDGEAATTTALGSSATMGNRRRVRQGTTPRHTGPQVEHPVTACKPIPFLRYYRQMMNPGFRWSALGYMPSSRGHSSCF